MNLKTNQKHLLILVSFIASIVFFNVGALLRNGRIWSFNYWAFWSYPLLLFVSVCLLILAVILFKRADISLRKKHLSQKKIDANSKYWLHVSMLSTILFIAFVVFRTQLHFLGDGYSLLSELSSDMPFIKPRNYLGTMPQYWIFQLINGARWIDALIAYRIISFSAGLLTLAILAVGLNGLFQKRQDKLLAFLGVISGGTTLLFFGYVENYAMFNMVVLAFCLVGMLAAENKLSKLWILPLVCGSVFFNYFGVALIPAAVYLLLCDTFIGKRISKLSKITKAVTMSIALVLAFLAFSWIYQNSYFYRLALVPIMEDQFTLEGYTLFSSAHLFDYLNMLFLLMPGLIIAIIGLLTGRLELNGPKQRTIFLLLVTLTSLSLIFIIDPKLGMARDWDMFAFAGLPFSLLVMDIYLRRQSSKSNAQLSVKMIIIIGIFILISRSVNLMDPKAALGLLDNNMRLDWLKYSNVIASLKQYAAWEGDSSNVNTMIRAHKDRFSELSEVGSMKNFKANNYADAAKGFEREIRLHPQRLLPYAYLAKCQMQAGLYDSATTLLEIAQGLDNYHPVVIDGLASVYGLQGDFKKAKKVFLKLLSFRKDHIPTLAKLTILYLSTGDLQKASDYFNRLSDQNDAPPMYFLTIGDESVSLGYMLQALRAYREAIKRGIPEDKEKELKSKYHEL